MRRKREEKKKWGRMNIDKVLKTMERRRVWKSKKEIEDFEEG
jgi:hypothetical protein